MAEERGQRPELDPWGFSPKEKRLGAFRRLVVSTHICSRNWPTEKNDTIFFSNFGDGIFSTHMYEKLTYWKKWYDFFQNFKDEIFSRIHLFWANFYCTTHIHEKILGTGGDRKSFTYFEPNFGPKLSYSLIMGGIYGKGQIHFIFWKICILGHLHLSEV